MALMSRFAKDCRGVAAVEFALIAPVMVLLYCGLVELSQAIIADSRTSHIASAVGDLVAQTSAVTASDVDDIFAIGSTFMAPFPTSTLKMRVTSVTANASGTPMVDWSRGYNGFVALGAGSTVALPMTLTAGSSVVMSESQYQYTSVIKYVLPNALTYNEKFYLTPRQSTQVTCTGC